jgi:lipopolysaccharide transport system ATP-binding protein
MPPDIVIEAKGLSKSYGLGDRSPGRVLRSMLPWSDGGDKFWALRDVDLAIRRGESVGIVGRNGSGKSTLLQVIAGTVAATSGDVEVRGRIAAALELGVAFHPEFTGRENVYLGTSILGLSRRKTTERFESIAAFAEIGAFMEQPVKHYSSGMYARLAFAVFAHVDPEILVIDEMLAVGDQSFRRKCHRFLQDYRRKGTLLFVSHDIGVLMRLCDRAIWLDHGEVRDVGPAEDICARYMNAPVRAAQVGGNRRFGARRGNWRQPPPPALVEDVRRKTRPAFAHRVEILPFDPNAPWHGHGGAVIEDTGFFGVDGTRLATMAAGDEVELRIAARAERDMPQPIIGFMLRDRLGQVVFGDNTFLAYEDSAPPIAAGQAFWARFRFQFPALAFGTFTVAPSIVEGTQEDHIHLHWMEEALILRVVSSHVRRAIVGVPLTAIDVAIEKA